MTISSGSDGELANGKHTESVAVASTSRGGKGRGKGKGKAGTQSPARGRSSRVGRGSRGAAGTKVSLFRGTCDNFFQIFSSTVMTVQHSIV